MNGKQARGRHTEEASRILPLKRGERFCTGDHSQAVVASGAPCPKCGAAK